LPQSWYYALGKLIYAIVKVLNPPEEEVQMMSTAKDQLSQSEKPLQKLWENLKHQFLNSLDLGESQGVWQLTVAIGRRFKKPDMSWTNPHERCPITNHYNGLNLFRNKKGANNLRG
jgi:hypothetical protein